MDALHDPLGDLVAYSAPESPSLPGDHRPAARQRGFYSELVDAKRGASTSTLSPVKRGPRSQKRPAARLFTCNVVLRSAADAALASAEEDPAGETELAAAPLKSTAEPKVYVAYDQHAGAAPRRVVIERQRRHFRQADVAALLLERGVDSSAAGAEESAAPLELFDDTEYDCRPVAEWAALTGETLLGRYFRRAADGTGSWSPCAVLSFDASAGLFTVAPLDEGGKRSLTTATVSRVNLCFDAEDPFVFAERVAAAHAARHAAAERMLFELCVDSMPTDGLPQIEASRMSRISKLAASSAQFASPRLANFSEQLAGEVQALHARALASMVLRSQANAAREGDHQAAAAFSNVVIPASEPPPAGAGTLLRCEDLPPHACLSQQHGFTFRTLLTTPEAVAATSKVRAECNRVLDLSLFSLDLTKSVPSEEFAQLQATHLSGVTPFLREHWPASIKNALRGLFKDLGKGWFNIHETRSEIYDQSKLKRFFRMAALMMQDAVVSMAEASVSSYVNTICERCDHVVTVRSASDVSVVSAGASGAGLFTLELAVGEDGAFFRVPPAMCKDAVLSVYARGVEATLGIPQIERQVMESLFWSDTPMLQTLSRGEGFVAEQQARLSDAVEKALPPAAEYLATFAQYRDYLILDEAAFAAKYEADERPIAEMVPEAKKHLQLAAEMEEAIPLRMPLGLFTVSCTAVRNTLVERHRSLAAIIVKRMSAAPMHSAHETGKRFAGVLQRLNQPTETIEEVAELEEYARQLPAELAELQEGIKAMVAEQEVVDQFEMVSPDADVKAFWATIALPRRVAEQIEAVGVKAAEMREQYAQEMQSEQAAFDKSLDRLEKVVGGFDKHTSFDRTKEVASEVRQLQLELKDAEEKRARFNKREVIFGQEQTDYSQLLRTSKAFEPYATLWLTADKWLESQKEWFGGAFNKLEPEAMEGVLSAAQRTLYKLSKTFEGAEGLSDIVTRVRQEIDDFSPNMPLITALRNPGMRERHWKQLSDEVGQDMTQAASDAFTLETMLSLNLGERVETVTKVCDVAGKEYAIETAMDKMEAEWKGVELEVVPYRESGTFVIKGVDAIQQVLDDQIVMTQSMAFSPFKGPFAERIDKWESTLTLISDIIEEWVRVQRAWMYLEPIFSSDDIMRQLPTEAKRFTGVDRTWRKLMSSASNELDVIAYCKTPRLLPQFQDANQMLELVQKGLAEYLETKRVAFSRFYFLSNDELLEILSQSKDPLAVQPHLKKCYEAIHKLTFEPDLAMTAMISGEGETAFEGVEASFSSDIAAWRAYFDSAETHQEQIPSGLHERLDPLQRLCVLRSVRPDKVVPGMQDYVKHYIGQRFIEPPPFDIGVSFKDSTNSMPIVFVISPGSDPYDDLLKLATELKMNKKLQAISLGQGQGPIAEKAMTSAMEKGSWILLQNCHLAASWMPKLEAIVEQYVPSEMHRDYRLWLTSLPSPLFPVSILQNSVKMTIEPPRGIKMNMKGSYNNITDPYLDAHPKAPQFKKLLYGLCFFHALLQDRRRFGALGFNIRYEFTAGDLKCCMLQLETYLAKYDEVPYQVLVNLFGHINYGGRITDDWDRRCVLTTLMSIVNEGIMSDTFMLAPGSDCYASPADTSVAGYLESIGDFPLNPHPNVFGLHANADITCAQNETQELCDIMLSLQPKVSTGGGKSREEVIAEVAAGLQARDLKPFPMDEIAARYPLSYEQSMNTVLSQECIRYNRLIRVYNKSLADLLKALKGLIVMSAELEAMATSLYSNQVPAMWAKVAYPSLKPLAAWVDDLARRIEFLQSWDRGGPPPAYWISGFFFPQAFLTGTLQNYARKHKVAIDTVSFAFHVMAQEPNSVAEAPEDGCYVFGMFLEGAVWDPDACLLAEARPKELYSVFPMLWLKPEVDRKPPTSGVYSCPLYKTTTRAGTLSTTGHSTNFVLMIELPSDKPCSGTFSRYAETFSAHWIGRAVALFTTLTY